MDISSLNGIQTDYWDNIISKTSFADSNKGEQASFDTVFQSVMSSLNETNDLQNAAESAEIQFALGESDNTHDLLIAMTKAEVALQYTVAVRDRLIEGYKELMQMQV